MHLTYYNVFLTKSVLKSCNILKRGTQTSSHSTIGEHFERSVSCSVNDSARILGNRKLALAFALEPK